MNAPEDEVRGSEVRRGSARRILFLRATIKLLVAVGLLFLLVPFVGSIPWPKDELPADATLVEAASFPAGSTHRLSLRTGGAVWVTRASPVLAAQLRAIPADRLWYPSAPGVASQEWFVVPEHSALGEPLRFLPASGDWPGGFVAGSGAAWDVAGRALKPWPGHPGGSAVKAQNLLPLPWRLVDASLVLVPMPAGAPAP